MTITTLRQNTVALSEQRVILWVRTSTDKQEIDTMTADLKGMASDDGYTPEQMDVIGSAGASARKLNQLYINDFNRLLSTCQTNQNVVAVYAWEVSRLARVELAFYRLKAVLETNGIQLKIYTGGYMLFEPDGRLRQGIELVLNVLATTAKQEMEIKRARMARGKERNRAEGRFNGGPNGCNFGYMIDSEGYIVVNQQESELIKLMFKLYSTGKYSYSDLARELRSRGFKTRNAEITDNFVAKTLKKTTFLGSITHEYADGVSHTLKYPQIITEGLFKKCRAIANENTRNNGVVGRSSQHVALAHKILKCRECGGNYMLNGDNYICYNANRGRYRNGSQCNVSTVISAKIMDQIIWTVAGFHYIVDRASGGSAEQTKLKEEIELLRQKQAAIPPQIQQKEAAKERALDLYVEVGRLKDKARAEAIDNEIAELKSDFDTLATLIDAHQQALNKTPNYYLSLSTATPDKQKELCLTYIKNAYIQRVGKKQTAVEIYGKDGGKFVYIYNFYQRKGQPYQLTHAEAGAMLRENYGVLRSYAVDSELSGGGLETQALSDLIDVLKSAIVTNTGDVQIDDMTAQYAEQQAEHLTENVEMIRSGFTQAEYEDLISELDEIGDRANDEPLS